VLTSAASVAQVNGFSFGASVAPHGVPASVTSFGFGGHPGFHGVPASVTSVTFGSAPLVNPPPFGFCCHHHRAFSTPFFAGAYYVPYAYPVFATDSDLENADEEDYRGGPTIFDRRGPGEYGERSRAGRERPLEEDRGPINQTDETGQAPPPEVSEQPRTVLVFKDGRELEVSNYAIIGPTLYDLTDGRTRKIQLGELDLNATVKQNDERGVEFELPRAANAN
jgi:hypothetical protein